MRLTLFKIIVAMVAGMLVAPVAGAGQPSPKVATVGVLLPNPASPTIFNAFRRGMQELGYVEGQTLTLELRHAEGQEAALPSLAGELVQRRVDVIFAAGDAAVRAAKQATQTVPIVMLINGDPVGSGLISSLRRPGGNVTGITGLSPKFSARRLDILKQVVPTLSHVALLSNPDDETRTLDQQQLQVMARALGIRLRPVTIRGPDAFEETFRTMVRAGVDGLIVLSTASTFYYRTQLVTLAAENRLPAIYERKEFVEVGGLMAYGTSLPDMLRQVASYVDKILQGAKPATLPVHQATKFELAIDLATANSLGLTIPPSLLAGADAVKH